VAMDVGARFDRIRLRESNPPPVNPETQLLLRDTRVHTWRSLVPKTDDPNVPDWCTLPDPAGHWKKVGLATPFPKYIIHSSQQSDGIP